MNVEPTVEVIDKMAQTLRDKAIELERLAIQMRNREDITYAAEAISTVSNMMNQLRIDLLVTRPLREYQR